MRILLAGASGLIGSEVVRRAGGHEVRALVRRPAGLDEYTWDPAAKIAPPAAFEWADAVISLSGASLSRLPWTRRYRREILRSRVDSTATIAAAIGAAQEPPTVWVAGSAVGVYGNRPGERLTERSAPGEGFLADVVREWERATEPAAGSTRIVHARTGIVLARRGALRPVILATRFGLGATVGTGEQHWPWISLTDQARALLHLAAASEVSGAVNLVAPNPATSREITTELARRLHRPHLLRLPAFALRAAMGAAAEDLLLADQRAEPVVLVDDGFTFAHGGLRAAVAAVVAP